MTAKKNDLLTSPLLTDPSTPRYPDTVEKKKKKKKRVNFNLAIPGNAIKR